MIRWVYSDSNGIGARWDGKVASLREHDEVPWILVKATDLPDESILAMQLGAIHDSKLVVHHAEYVHLELDVFLGLSCIKHLDLHGNMLKDQGLNPHQWEQLQENEYITSMRAYNLALYNNGALALASNTTITLLDLNKCHAGIENAEILSKNRKLRVLRMSRNTVWDTGAEAIARISSLEELDISLNGVRDGGARALCKHRKLRVLNASSNNITPYGIEPIEDNMSMTSLNLATNTINKTGVFARNKTLEHLEIRYNGLRPGELAVLATNNVLTSLTTSCIFDGSGAEALVALANNTSLTRLDLEFACLGCNTADISPLCKNTTIKTLVYTTTEPSPNYGLTASITTLTSLSVGFLTKETAEIVAKNGGISYFKATDAEPPALDRLFQSRSLETVHIGRAIVDARAARAICANTHITTFSTTYMKCLDLETCEILSLCPSFVSYGQFALKTEFATFPGAKDDTSELPLLRGIARNRQRRADLRGKFMVFCAIFAKMRLNMRNKRALPG